MHVVRSLLILLGVCAGTTMGYPSGKVEISCEDMMPVHRHDPRPDPPPFTVTVDKNTFKPDEGITVTLQAMASGSLYFKGFLMEARDAEAPESAAVGSFRLLNHTASQLLNCGHVKGSAVSHTSGSKKTKVQAVWAASSSPLERVQFFVTVVHKYKEYWVKIPGPVVTREGGTIVPPSPTHPVPTTTPAVLHDSFSSDGCGSSKSCLRDPVACRPETNSNCFFMSFTTNAGDSSVMFELSGPAEGYVSFALSLDKWMGNDDIYLCVRDGGRVIINAAYVTGRHHPEISSEAALWGQAWRLSDGVIQCRFHRNILLPHQEGRFNLNQSHYLFLAHGRAHQGSIHRHDRQPLISTYQTNITGPPEDLTGSRSPLLIKVHGVLMLMGWMWIVSTGVLVARHYKHLCPDTTLFGQRVWFQVHRSLMVLAVAFTGVAFILPFLYRKGWSKHAGSHPYLGCTVLTLSLIQPIMALLRPAPDSSWRYLFNWLHLGTGSVAQIIAVASIFLGMRQQALLLPDPGSKALVAGWVVWVLLADLVLVLHSRMCRAGENGSDDKEGILEPRNRESGRHLKTIVLAVFLIGNTVFLIVLADTIGNV